LNRWLNITRDFLTSIVDKIVRKKRDSPPFVPFLPDPFFGYADLDDKKNVQVNIRVDRDGTSVMRARLSVGDKHLREEIIAKHFITHLSRMDRIGTAPLFLKRDDPWDFQIQLDESVVNLEITAISDNETQFMWLNEQDRMGSLLGKATLIENDFNKVKKYFDSEFLEKIRIEKSEGTYSPRVILRSQHFQDDNVKSLVLSAVDKKTEKRHKDKDKTILIIENRTSHITPKDILEFQRDISLEIQKYPFLEIWFYVGCYSDDDGGNAAFAFCQLK